MYGRTSVNAFVFHFSMSSTFKYEMMINYSKASLINVVMLSHHDQRAMRYLEIIVISSIQDLGLLCIMEQKYL